IWADLYDRTGKIQVQFRKDVLGDETFERARLLGRGDIVVAEGPRFVTRQGELTLQAREVILATKSLHPLPDTTGHFGLTNVDLRYREGYVDLLVTRDAREVYSRRTKLMRYLRNFL